MDKSKKDEAAFARTMTPAEAETDRLGKAATEISGPWTMPPADMDSNRLALARTENSGVLKFPTLSEGEKAGKFLILKKLGEGGMGTVYSAHDPDLDRNVALKMLRRSTNRQSQDSRTRLIREAKIMAKLQHPNIVTVYEVEAIGDGVCIAMEYMSGGTLGEWCKAASGSWKEILEKYLEAGKGLSIAHDAGLVHRDFKPDNVLISKRGRVAVSDFGIVGGSNLKTEDRKLSDDLSNFDLALTRTGDVLGTPLYMSPEQYKGEKTDPRSDQFSFCVSLYDALYNEHPFGGTTYSELFKNVIDGRIRDRKSTGIPDHILQTLKKGMATQPDERFESMGVLISELKRDPKGERKRKILSTVAVAIFMGAIGAALYLFMVVPKSTICELPDRQLVGIWDRDVKRTMLRALEGTERPYAKDTFKRVEMNLDRFFSTWKAMWMENCRATHFDGVQSTEVLDLRTACLLRKRNEVSALINEFQIEVRLNKLHQVVLATSELPYLQRCENVKILKAAYPFPEDERIRTNIEVIEKKLDKAEALGKTGDSGVSRAETDDSGRLSGRAYFG